METCDISYEGVRGSHLSYPGKELEGEKIVSLGWKMQMEVLYFEVLYFCHHVIIMQHKWLWLKNGLCLDANHSAVRLTSSTPLVSCWKVIHWP